MFDELITKDQLIASPWQEVMNDCKEQACSDFHSALSSKVNELGEESEHALPLKLLSSICSMYMTGYRKKGEPFGPMWIMDGRRTFLPEDLTEAQAEELYLFLSHISVPDLKARIADTLWIAKKNRDKYQAAKTAVTEYIKAGNLLLEDPHPIRGVDRLERAVSLSAELGRGGDAQMRDSLSACRKALRQLSTSELNASQLRLIQTLYRFGNDGHCQLGGICFDLSEKIEKSAFNWDLSRSYWEQTAKIFETCGQPAVSEGARRRMAWTYIKQARTAGSYIVKASVLANAIEAFRRINESRKKIDLLHKWLLRVERLTYKEMKEFSTGPMDITELVNDAQDKVSGKNTQNALVAFGLLTQLSDPAKLKAQAIKNSQEFVLSSLFGGHHLNAQGKVVAKTPPIGPEQAESDDEALLHKMHFDFDINCRIQVTGGIEPARRQLIREHRLNVEDLWPIVTNSPFVPQGREMIFARGLAAGFEGDYLVASHLLIPQVEHSLRYILEQKGGVPSTINAQGIQQERMINDLLDDPLITAALGEQVVFSFKALLVEKTGANFRHSLCHGLYDHNNFYTHTAVFIWWLIFRLCYTPWLSEWLQKAQQAKRLLSLLRQRQQGNRLLGVLLQIQNAKAA